MHCLLVGLVTGQDRWIQALNIKGKPPEIKIYLFSLQAVFCIINCRLLRRHFMSIWKLRLQIEGNRFVKDCTLFPDAIAMQGYYHTICMYQIEFEGIRKHWVQFPIHWNVDCTYYASLGRQKPTHIHTHSTILSSIKKEYCQDVKLFGWKFMWIMEIYIFHTF